MKYIIEIKPEYEGTTKGIIVLGIKNNCLCVDELAIEELEELNSDYINEHFSDLQDDAYKRGVNDGSLDVKQRVEGAYQKGIEDGKAVNDKGCEGCRFEGTRCTACENCCNSHMNHWTAKDDKIEVGDTVNLKDSSRDNDGIVTKSWDNDRHFIMWADGSGGVWDKEYIVKTGRHFDIGKILEAMKHD